MSMATRTDTQSPALHVADRHDLIRVQGARVNNLKDVSIEIPKRRLTVFTGVSGSGKSSLVFGTIAAESQRMINETYSAFVQGFMPTLARPDVDVLDGLTTAIIVDQERMGANARSTVGTATDANERIAVGRVRVRAGDVPASVPLDLAADTCPRHGRFHDDPCGPAATRPGYRGRPRVDAGAWARAVAWRRGRSPALQHGSIDQRGRQQGAGRLRSARSGVGGPAGLRGAQPSQLLAHERGPHGRLEQATEASDPLSTPFASDDEERSLASESAPEL